MISSLVRLVILVLLIAPNPLAQTRVRRSPPVPRSVSTLARPALTRWYALVGPDKDFTIEFPSKPERTADDEAPSGTSRNYLLALDFQMFHLAFMDTGVAPHSREGNQLPLDFRQGMLNHARERGWTMIRLEILRKNVYEQETWTPLKRNPNQSLHYIERTVVRYGRQYILSCSSLLPDEQVNREVCRRFLDSFRVLGEPQPQ